MITYYTVGGLGNQMFGYCFARIMAKKFDMPFDGQGHHFDGIVNGQMLQKFGIDFYGPKGRKREGDPQYLSGQYVDMDAIDPERPIILGDDGRGWFQRYEYYRGWKTEIKEWLNYSTWRIPSVPENNLCINVRQGDFIKLGVALPTEAYVKAVESFDNFDSVSIVTDTRDTETVQALIDKYDVKTVVAGKPLQCLWTVMAHKKLICSDSTFSWWGAWLGAADDIVTLKRSPKSVIPWDGSDIRVYDEPRYRYLQWAV